MFGNLPFPGGEGRRFSLRACLQPDLELQAASVVWHWGHQSHHTKLGVAVAKGTSRLSGCLDPRPVALSALVSSSLDKSRDDACLSLSKVLRGQNPSVSIQHMYDLHHCSV